MKAPQLSTTYRKFTRIMRFKGMCFVYEDASNDT